MVLSTFCVGVALPLVITAGLTVAQNTNPAFITTCLQGTWALTFDDGPSTFTPELLEYLKQANVNATFFVLGIQLADPLLAQHTKKAFDDGHLIASHTYNHKDLNAMTSAEIEKEMMDTEAAVKNIIGYTPRYMRPPYGNCSENCAAVMKKLGYSVFTWNVDSNDWKVVGTKDEPKALDPFTVVLSSPAAITSGFQSLQHDTYQFSVKHVPQIIKAVLGAGIRFVTVDECMTSRRPAYLEAGAPYSGITSPPNTTPALTATAAPDSAPETTVMPAEPLSQPSVSSPAFRTTASSLALVALVGATLPPS